MSDFKTYTRICVDCGMVLNNVGRSTQRCPECGKKHANALSLEWNRRRNEEIQAQRQGLAAERSRLALYADVRAAEKSRSELRQVHAAEDAGKQKARRCANTDELQGMMDSLLPITPMIP